MKERMEKVRKNLNHSPVYMCLYGSQNYQMDAHTDEYQSDFDYKAIIVPTLKDLVFNSKPISKVVEVENGQVDVKDVRSFFETLSKCNPAFVECMMTPHWIGDNEFETARTLMPAFVWELRESFIKACYGMMLEKFSALQHPYPSVRERLERFHYDPKQLHHMLRLYKMMEDFQETGKVVLVPSNKDYLLEVKLGCYSVEEAVHVAQEYKEKGANLRDFMTKEYLGQCHTYDAVHEMKQFGLNYLEKKIREEVIKNEKTF